MASDDETGIQRLVVNTDTGFYLKKDGGWTPVSSEAVDFDSISTLLRTCAEQRITRAKAVLRSRTDPRFKVEFDVPSEPT